MNLTNEIKKSIDQSVLCWLATVSEDYMPNVSPKEIFTYFGKDKIILANIASPQTVKNIKNQENVCLSFIDILVQKGFQIKGKARILTNKDSGFLAMEKVLLKMTGGNFPFATITVISVEAAKPILAPSYLLYPNTTTEAEQIKIAKKAYGF
jgi:predicted pyridoxine 5'-phosphate oxidase superfamily flavin-nucleotide-binding protein